MFSQVYKIYNLGNGSACAQHYYYSQTFSMFSIFSIFHVISLALNKRLLGIWTSICFEHLWNCWHFWMDPNGLAIICWGHCHFLSRKTHRERILHWVKTKVKTITKRKSLEFVCGILHCESFESISVKKQWFYVRGPP